ncbi:Nn.00g102770.m01.CDS01 [Neocucurbitaria sp. VM-36]
MNFVDVQPKSFLDYAWTSPTPAAAMESTKPSKTNRKQNRCCDQCRKGKRACDAAILEDTLLDTNRSGGNPTVFHYSDVFGPLTSCANCEKTKKKCTFEWLRSQRVSQAAQPPQSSAPPAKRRRTQNSSSGVSQVKKEASVQSRAVRVDSQPDTVNGGDSVSHINPIELGITFGDFPGLNSALEPSSISLFSSAPSLSLGQAEHGGRDSFDYLSEAFEDNQALLHCDSGKGSSVDTLSEGFNDRLASVSPYESHTEPAKTSRTVTCTSRKRRRRSPEPFSNGALPCPTISFASDLILSTNNAYLTEGLLRIYHDSFENALACWLTERTCPYTARVDVSTNVSTSPDWDRIYYRVFRLDRLAASIRGRQLTFTEDKAASRALNMAIYAFASQWAQSSQRSRAKYPFQNNGAKCTGNVFEAGDAERVPDGIEFDRAIQISAWHEAQNALHIAGEIESFRVVLAEIVFALTQKPIEKDEDKETHMREPDQYQESHLVVPESDGQELAMPLDAEDPEVTECEDLLSKLNLAMDTEGPPVHLEKGLRLIHSLRSRLAICGAKPRTITKSSRCGKKYRPSAGRLEKADRATVDLLFWLGVMFDTLSAAMHKRPLVVSDEDSDMVLNESREASDLATDSMEFILTEKNDAHWDDYLFACQQARLQDSPTRWPCTFDQATAVLCDAAPVKVLLFRRITRIQTLLARNSLGEEIEKALKAALDVCDHWSRLYAPFIQDCINDHDRLPSRIQSWYICLTGHWHFATLLLADLIEIVDESELGLEEAQKKRSASGLVACLRENNCWALSDLASCACPREGASFPQSREFHFAVNQGALLTEPWTAVLIRAFAKAGVVLLESEAMLPSYMDEEDTFRRADNCVRALWYLGRKSDMALSAATILGDALKQRRKSAREKVDAMSAFLQDELWHGFEGLNEAFGVDCET